MKRAIYLALIMTVMALAACTANAPVSESKSSQVAQASTAAEPIQPPRKYLAKGAKLPIAAFADVGITVYGSCSVAFCDGDWNDVQNVSFVSCSNGSCTPDNYWICGGPCEPETTSCSCSDL